MKNNKMISLIIALNLVFTACESNQTPQANTEINGHTEVWENGVSTVKGVISKVTPEKDGQTIELTTDKGVKYTAVVSIPNLRENASQYRKFEVGESIGFKGEFFKLGEENRMVVREVLEMK